MNDKLLSDMIKRVKGDFYIGVVGSVRSGKSLFIKRFMELKVLPYINDKMLRDKIIDELPQSASGKTIMTVEPKFIPSNGIEITLNSEMKMDIKLVDSVGYIIPNAIGHYTEQGPRLVKTPWFNDPIPFKEASLIGTKKVITNHSTLGIMMTSDGSISEFKREDYQAVEEEIIMELKALDKPFVVVVNSANPNTTLAKNICDELTAKYGVPAVAINVLEMNANDIDEILGEALNEFPILELNIMLPSYLNLLDENNHYAKEANDIITGATSTYKKFKDIDRIKRELSKYENFEKVIIEKVDPSMGLATMQIEVKKGIYEEMLQDLLGEVKDKGDFINLLSKYQKAFSEYENIKPALDMVKSCGYGIAVPKESEMVLDEPKVINQGSRYGLRLKAVAPSIHMVKVNVESTFEPIIGSKEQSESLVANFKNDEDIWKLEIFGRSLSECLGDGIKAKLHLFPEKAREKLRFTLEKIVNNNSGGLIAIIL